MKLQATFMKQGRVRGDRLADGAGQVDQQNWLSQFTTFAVGVGIGALVGLLLAPASGKKTHNDMAAIAKDGFDDAAFNRQAIVSTRPGNE